MLTDRDWRIGFGEYFYKLRESASIEAYFRIYVKEILISSKLAENVRQCLGNFGLMRRENDVFADLKVQRNRNPPSLSRQSKHIFIVRYEVVVVFTVGGDKAFGYVF